MSTSTYDELPYLGFPRRHSHPSVIAANARIFGVDAPEVETARILELGCGDGANLMSIAASLPESTCCGVDFSKTQIDKGKRTVAIAETTNAELLQGDFTDCEFPSEEYDYIIAHGVYSWISDPEQERMLERIRELLSQNGVAFVSYNCFPGWNLRRLTREMMLFQTRHLDSPQDKVDLARKVLPTVVQSVPEGLRGYAALLNDEQSLVNGTGDYYIAHEHLEEDNRPCYFHEFAERLAGHELQYLCEAEIASMYLNRYPAPLLNLRQEAAGSPEARIEAEQLLDYAVFRMFRQSLVVGAKHDVGSSISPSVVRDLHASAFGDFEGQPEFTNQPETYQSSKGIGITTSSPAAKAALYVLATNWPERMDFPSLVDGVRDLVEVDREPAEQAISDLLLAAYTTDGVELHAAPGNFTREVTEKPVVSPLARNPSEDDKSVFTLRHLSYEIDPLSRILLREFDGTKTPEDVVPILEEAIESGRLPVPDETKVPDDPDDRKEFLLKETRDQLRRMADMGLLVR